MAENEESRKICERMINWLGLSQLEEEYQIKVEEMDVSIACQYTGNQVVHPSRSESCDISCLVEKQLIV